MDAWELALKAYIYRHISPKQIWEHKKTERTIPFSKAIIKVCDDINAKSKKTYFVSVKSNLFLLEEYRNKYAHFFEAELDPVIFMLISKATINFCEFISEYFNKDILRDENLILLPVGFKLPFDPVDFFKTNAVSSIASQFVTQVLSQIKLLNDNNIPESIVVGFDISLASVKKISNADLIAAIDNANPDATALVRTVRLTDSPNATAVRIDEQGIRDSFPLDYKDLISEVKTRLPNIKINTDFHRLNALVKQNKEYCYTRFLDPNNPKSSKKDLYSKSAVDSLVKALTK
jgi:hypothetical protein